MAAKKYTDNPSGILLKGCRQHNLKNLTLTIPKNAVTVITGVSGSGKSSLAFDTLYAEGQHRYLAHLSPEARMLIRGIPKPDIDLIEGLAPTLAVNQGRQALYARGTVATYTDIYDLLSLLYVNIGEQHSPGTGKRLIRYTRQEIVEILLKELEPGTRFQLLAPVGLNQESAFQALTRLQQMGYVRFKIRDQEWMSENPLPNLENIQEIDVVIDRLEIKEGIRDRLAHSIETALNLSQGLLKVQLGRTGPLRYFTEIYVCSETGVAFAPLTVKDFNFNSARGACSECFGIGSYQRVNPDLLKWDPALPLAEQIAAILDNLPKKIVDQLNKLVQAYWKFIQLPKNVLAGEIPDQLMDDILYGSDENLQMIVNFEGREEIVKVKWGGLIHFLDQALYRKKTKGRLDQLPFIEWQTCPACKGERLKPQSLACWIKGKGIHQLCHMNASELLAEISNWVFTGKEAQIAAEILPSIQIRLKLLEQVGLGYMELNRPGSTLSDGEAQRIQLASQIGAKLSGIIYILDEPSLGLHQQDIQHLQQIINELKALDNTVIMVEHERSLISQADHVVELGPGAGIHGGELIFQGKYKNLLKDTKSPTGQWLSGRAELPKAPVRKMKKNWLQVSSVSLHNLKDFSVRIPLGCLVGFCGVSGSGKSTLVLDIIGEQVHHALTQSLPIPGLAKQDLIKRVVINEKLTDRFSARSIPATYVGLMTPLRKLFAETRLAKARGYTAARFSLNKRGGRCDACEGLGQMRVHMQFMSDFFVPCGICQGERYNYETLQITWENLNIAEVLNLPVEKAAQIFSPIPEIAGKLELMRDLGLDYLTLGQPFNTLSSGEIQRLRLVADLADPSLLPTLYILDEPSSGLHFQDIRKLLVILQRLVDKGHSIFMIEHHLDLLRQADWLIELGPGAGPKGGKLIFEGKIEELIKNKSPTGKVLNIID